MKEITKGNEMSLNSNHTDDDILRDVRAAIELISDPERWTRNILARDRAGHRCPASHPSAVRWCIVGALIKTGDVDRVPSAVTALNTILTKSGVLDVIAANDDSKNHTELIKLLWKAYKTLEKESKYKPKEIGEKS